VGEGEKPSYIFSNLLFFIQFILYSNQLIKLYNFIIFHDFHIIIVSRLLTKNSLYIQITYQVQGFFQFCDVATLGFSCGKF
jgi:hypothetical protein